MVDGDKNERFREEMRKNAIYSFIHRQETGKVKESSRHIFSQDHRLERL